MSSASTNKIEKNYIDELTGLLTHQTRDHPVAIIVTTLYRN